MSASVPCPLCGGSQHELVTDRVRLGKSARVYLCRACGMTFLDPGSFTYPRDFYEREYHQTYITHVEPDALDPAKYAQKMKKATRIWADKVRAILTGKEFVLDVGCSTGHFMELIQDRTARIAGSELSRKEVEYCRDVCHLDVSDRPLEERFEESSLDLITMIFVLEHIASPRDFLRRAMRLLKASGKLVIVVPALHDPLVSCYDIPEFRDFYFCIEHLFYYTQPTLRRLLSDVGLEGDVEIVQEYPITNHLGWVFRRGPSDVLASRQGTPGVPIRDAALEEQWSALWADLDRRYRQFLQAHGFGDRLWCVVGKSR